MLTENQKMAMDLLKDAIERAVSMVNIIPNGSEISYDNATEIERILLTSINHIGNRLSMLHSLVKYVYVLDSVSDIINEKIYHVCDIIRFTFEIIPKNNCDKNVLFAMCENILKSIKNIMEGVERKVFDLLNTNVENEDESN